MGGFRVLGCLLALGFAVGTARADELALLSHSSENFIRDLKNLLPGQTLAASLFLNQKPETSDSTHAYRRIGRLLSKPALCNLLLAQKPAALLSIHGQAHDPNFVVLDVLLNYEAALALTELPQFFRLERKGSALYSQIPDRAFPSLGVQGTEEQRVQRAYTRVLLSLFQAVGLGIDKKYLYLYFDKAAPYEAFRAAFSPDRHVIYIEGRRVRAVLKRF